MPSTRDIQWTELSEETAPRDTVQSMAFQPNAQTPVIAVGSWDCTVRLYKVDHIIGAKPILQAGSVFNFESPPIELRWTSMGEILIVLTGDGLVSAISGTDGQMTSLFSHPGAIFASSVNLLGTILFITISSDQTLNYWTSPDLSKPFKSVKLNYMPLCADHNVLSMLIPMDKNHVAFLKFEQPEAITYLNTGIEIQPNLVAISPTTYDFLIGTVDGRILSGDIQFSDGRITLNRKIVFKAHKLENSEGIITLQKALYPITGLGFPEFEKSGSELIFSTGSDGNLKIWDLKKKETILEIFYQKIIKKPLVTCAISPGGKYSVAAFGYDWSSGVWGLKNASNSVLGIVINSLTYSRI